MPRPSTAGSGCEMLSASRSKDDWQNFPPAVQRKYFSTLERLRLAQSSTATANRSASSSSTYGTYGALGCCKRVPTTSQRPTLVRRNSSYFKNPGFRRKNSLPAADTYSPSDAQWFLRLPEKVQRRHFTEEERLLLSGQTDTAVLPDAADKKFERELYKLGRDANRSVPTLRTSSFSSLSSLSTFDLEPPVDSAVDMDESIIWFDDDNEVDLDSRLQLDDYHEFINKSADHSNRSSGHSPSFRRALSLSSLPFGANASSPSKATPPLPAISIPQNSQRTVPQPVSPVAVRKPSLPSIEPSTRHYQDPEARLKLRVYLSSSQKFDEAIEFGFPSVEEKDSLRLPLHRPSLSRSHNTAPCKTFLHDDSPSLIDALDDSDDSASLPERDNLHTPPDSTFHDATLLSPSVAASDAGSLLFSNAHKPQIRRYSNEPFAQLLAGSREMTLRMTLTRPDLRADEKALYAHTTGDDPLALEHLPPAKKEGDIWDTMPKDRSVVRRFWRKLSGRP
ncbi:hypothetical protein ACLMJK_002677 [Lecanora helva]